MLFCFLGEGQTLQKGLIRDILGALRLFGLLRGQALRLKVLEKLA